MRCDDALRILENADRLCNERVIDAENAVEEAFEAVDKLKTAIVIPEGATIGDVIKLVFPWRKWSEGKAYVQEVRSINPIHSILVPKALWNASYESMKEVSRSEHTRRPAPEQP